MSSNNIHDELYKLHLKLNELNRTTEILKMNKYKLLQEVINGPPLIIPNDPIVSAKIAKMHQNKQYVISCVEWEFYEMGFDSNPVKRYDVQYMDQNGFIEITYLDGCSRK